MMNNIEYESPARCPLKYRGWKINAQIVNSEFFIDYDESRKKWFHQWVNKKYNGEEENFFEADNTRVNGFFSILDCLNTPESNRFSDVHTHVQIYCNGYIDKFEAIEPNWEPDWINPIFRDGSYAEKYGSSISNPRHSYIFQDTHKVFDGKPNFYISYTNLVDLNKPIDYPDNEKPYIKAMYGYEICDDLEMWYINIAPHYSARTLGELFKLIIDWDLAYHHFNNRDKIAILCHKILGSIEMPADVYESLNKEMPDSVVKKYMKGQIDCLYSGDRPKTPQIAIDWFKEKYWDLRHTHIDEWLNTGEVVDNHYYNRLYNYFQ